tara:strand:- start:4890 stop:5606 length:717 start_codon:yes stop_codon:yes gene_type:complete
MTHCGGRIVDFNEVASVPLPEQTNTYIPVPYENLVLNTRKIADRLLNEYSFVKDQFALSGGENKDQRMFAVLQYEANNSEMGYAIGIRSSYDKSMSNGFCAGAQIFVCDNLMFRGEVTYMRKHTKNVWNDIEEKTMTTLYRGMDNFQNLSKDSEQMKERDVSNDIAGSFLGRLFINGDMTPRQLQKAKQQWFKPIHEEFEPNTLWSLYNACTESLKTTPPNKILEKHISLHRHAMALC